MCLLGGRMHSMSCVNGGGWEGIVFLTDGGGMNHYVSSVREEGWESRSGHIFERLCGWEGLSLV